MSLSIPRPQPQSKIIGILWMVPIYAVDSFLSLRFKNVAIYVDMLRDCYEGYALYLFLALMVGYLGDGDEYKVQHSCWSGEVFFLRQSGERQLLLQQYRPSLKT